MAKNPPVGDQHRAGAVREMSQTFNPHTDRWVKRDTDTGRFLDHKSAIPLRPQQPGVPVVAIPAVQ